MQAWMTLVLVLQMLTAFVMIGLVLIQHGKGADMGASFGGGASGSLFGATGSANFLSRSTAACATVFFVTTLALAFMANDRSGRPTTAEWLPWIQLISPSAEPWMAYPPALPAHSPLAR